MNMDKIEKTLVIIIFIMIELTLIGTLVLAIMRAIGGEFKFLVIIPLLIAVGRAALVAFREIMKDY